MLKRFLGLKNESQRVAAGVDKDGYPVLLDLTDMLIDMTTGIRLSMRRGLTGRIVHLYPELQQKGLVCINSAVTSSYSGMDATSRSC